MVLLMLAMKPHTLRVFLLISLLPFSYDCVYARPQRSHRNLIRRDTVTDSCSDSEKAALTDALNEVKTIADNTARRTQDFRNWIQGFVKGHTQTKITQDQWVAYRTFFAMFGRVLWDLESAEGDRTRNGDGLAFIDDILDAASKLQTNVLNEKTKLDYYCGDKWLENKDPDGNVAAVPVYWDGRPTNTDKLQWINVGGHGACRDDPQLEGQLFRHGDGIGGPVDVMMICQSSIESWRETSLTKDKNAKILANTKSLDDYKSKASGIILIHELSHSDEVMGEGYGTRDPKLDGGDIVLGVPFDFATLSATNYGWYGVQRIAGTNNYENQNIAIKAAENIAFYAAALYLDKNLWANGYAEDIPSIP